MVVRTFARTVGADLSEAAEAAHAFPSVSAFFTRRLRPGSRSWPPDPAVPASPVDGIVGQVGRIRQGRAIQAKGMEYGVDELLDSPVEGARFGAGWFVTLYLSPRHYHRIHAPVYGEVRVARALPGSLLPVNDAAVRRIPRLFPRNERLVAHLAARGGGEVAVVAVGAFNVGRISASFDPDWGGPGGRGVTNRPGRIREERAYEPPVPVERGGELMAFHLGSTVVLLLDEDVAGRGPHPDLVPGREIRLGAPLFT